MAALIPPGVGRGADAKEGEGGMWIGGGADWGAEAGREVEEGDSGSDETALGSENMMREAEGDPGAGNEGSAAGR